MSTATTGNGRHTVAETYRLGVGRKGWECSTCGREFHLGTGSRRRERRVFGRVIAHTVTRHRRLPRGKKYQTFTFTYRWVSSDGSAS